MHHRCLRLAITALAALNALSAIGGGLMQPKGKPGGKEVLTPSQRCGEFISLMAMVLFFAFFVDHQTTQTGFFTARFGVAEMLCVYGPMLLSLMAPIVRVFTGRRNPARPFEVETNGRMALAAIWLLLVFPFNFAHVSDVLPAGIRFLLGWITNDVSKVVLILQLGICPIAAVVSLGKYLSIRQRASSALSTPPPFSEPHLAEKDIIA